MDDERASGSGRPLARPRTPLDDDPTMARKTGNMAGQQSFAGGELPAGEDPDGTRAIHRCGKGVFRQVDAEQPKFRLARY